MVQGSMILHTAALLVLLKAIGRCIGQRIPLVVGHVVLGQHLHALLLVQVLSNEEAVLLMFCRCHGQSLVRHF